MKNEIPDPPIVFRVDKNLTADPGIRKRFEPVDPTDDGIERQMQHHTGDEKAEGLQQTPLVQDDEAGPAGKTGGGVIGRDVGDIAVMVNLRLADRIKIEHVDIGKDAAQKQGAEGERAGLGVLQASGGEVARRQMGDEHTGHFWFERKP